jgi:hypothetical protein
MHHVQVNRELREQAGRHDIDSILGRLTAVRARNPDAPIHPFGVVIACYSVQ